MSFSMQVADENAVKQEVMEEVKVDSEETLALRRQAEKNAEEIISCDPDSPLEKKKFSQAIDQFGLDSISRSSNKNALLKVSIGNLSKSGDEGGEVSKGLLDLRREIKDLDPGAVDFAKTGVLGKLINPVRRYFEKYEKAETVIADIVKSLDKGKATLKNDNTTLALEEQSLRDITKQIYKEIEMGTLMDESLAAKIEQAKLEGADADQIRFVEEEVLFPLRQRVMDMQQMVVVNQQGIIAMEIIRRNNKELIRGVDRAQTVTVTALRTAVMVASALYNQKIVLKKIEMLNETTNTLISGTSALLKEQGAAIHKQSMQTGVSVETLKASFSDLMSALDSISTYKQEALPVMRQTIDSFREMAAQGEVQVKKLERGSGAED
ncbi:MAG TPA: toxic anion resistance protein [Ruminococcaceae bacterium]|nr:toxic anion resistance protein [Oscillospiraceae bacterium]